MNTGIGQLIKNVRIDKNVAQKRLSRGICAASVLAKYEAGIREMDGLTFIALMNRLGLSADGFEFMVDLEEYDYYRWRCETLTYIINGEWSELDSHRHYNRIVPKGISSILHLQYELYIEAIISLINGRVSRFCECIVRSLRCTYIVRDIDSLKAYIGMGRFELHLYMLYLYSKKERELIDKKEIESILAGIYNYVHDNIRDMNELQKIYSELIMAEDILVGNPGCRTGGREGYNYRKLLTRYNEYGILPDMQIEAWIRSWREDRYHICLINEYLRAERADKGLSQNQFVRGICESETYSRIESGGRRISSGNYGRLKERLGIEYGNYRNYIINYDSRVHMLMKHLEYAMTEHEYMRAEQLIRMIIESIDTDKPVNRQYVDLISAIIRKRQEYIDEEQMIEECKNILYITMNDISRVKRFLTRTELELLYQMAESYNELNKNDEVIKIIKIVVQNRQKKSSIYDESIRRQMIEKIIQGDKKTEDENIEEYIDTGMKFIRAEIDVF